MRCPKADKLMSPYIDGEISGLERYDLEAHTRECRRCAEKLEALEKMHALFEKAGHYNAPYGFSTKLLARAGSEEKAAGRVPVYLRLAEAALFMLVVASGILSGNFLVSRPAPARSAPLTAALSLDVFDSAPADSPAGVYLTMTEERHEE